MPAKLEGFGIAQANDRYIYVCGGYDLATPKSTTPACPVPPSNRCGNQFNQITEGYRFWFTHFSLIAIHWNFFIGKNFFY